MSQILSSRMAHVGLILLLLFYLAWDLRAVTADQRVGPTDTSVEEAEGLLAFVAEGELDAMARWTINARKGPMAGILIALLTPLVGEPLLASRVLGISLHLLLLLAIFQLVARLTGRFWAGLLAVVLCGTFPGEYGWFRMEYHESLLILVTLLAVWQLAGDLSSRRRAVGLGLTLALGILCKVPFPVFVIGPGVLFLARNLRSRRDLANAGVAALTFALAAGWYLVPNLLSIAEYMDGSHEPQFFDVGESFRAYFQIIPRTIPHLGIGLLAAPLLWLLGGAPHALIASLASSIITGTLILLYFDPWARYLAPAFPMAGVLSALGIASLVRRLPRRQVILARAAMAMLAISLLGLYVRDNIVGISHPEGNREWGAGLISPDRRPYMALPWMTRWAREHKVKVHTMGWSSKIEGCPEILRHIWQRRGLGLPLMDPQLIEQHLYMKKPLHLVLCHKEISPLHALTQVEIRGEMDQKVLAAARWWRVQPLVNYINPDGVRLTMLRLVAK